VDDKALHVAHFELREALYLHIQIAAQLLGNRIEIGFAAHPGQGAAAGVFRDLRYFAVVHFSVA
jgi:hypothetical protein